MDTNAIKPPQPPAGSRQRSSDRPHPTSGFDDAAIAEVAFGPLIGYGAGTEIKLLVRDVADYDRVYKKMIKAVPLSDVSASFAMERIKYETAVPV